MEIEGVSIKIGIKNEFSSQLPAITSGLNSIQKQSLSASATIQKSFGSSLAKSFSSLGSGALKGLSSAFSGVGKIVTSSFGTAKTAINSFANSAKSSFKGIQSSLGKSFGSINLSSLKSSLSGVQKTVSSTFSGIKNGLKNLSFSGIGTKIKSSLNSAFSSIKTSVTSLGTSLKSKLTSSFSGIGDKIKSSLSSAQTKLQSFVSTAESGFKRITAAGSEVSKQLGVIGTVILGVFTNELKSAIESATSIFMTFDDQMRKVQAVTESTGEQFEALTTQAKLLGATTSFTAQDAAEAMTYLGQAGFTSTQIIAAMPATLNLARASMTELGTTADIMSNIMNGFQIGAEDTTRAADVLSKAANATNTDVTGLGQAMKYAAPLAHQMGWSLEETAAAAGMLSNAGIKADMAGTVLRNSITRLIAPTDKTVMLLAKYGISIDMVNPKVYSLAQILDTLTAAGVSSGDMMSIFGMRAGPGMMALVNQGTTALKNMNQTLIDSGGYAQKAADEMDAGWGGVVRLLGDTVEALQLSFGGALANILTPFAKAVSVVGYAISQLHPVIIYIASAFALASVAAGTLLIGLSVLPTVVTTLTTALTFAGRGITVLAESIGVLTKSTLAADLVFEAMSLPMATIVVTAGEVVLAIAAIGIALYELEEKTKIFSKTWETLKDLWTIGTYYIGQAFDSFKTSVSNAVDSITDKLHELLDDTWIGSFVDIVTGAYETVSSVLGDARSSIHETAESIRDDQDKQAESAENVKSQIETANQGIVSSYQTVDEATGQTYSSMIEDAGSMSEGVTSSNSEVMSSNNELISSNQAVSESSPTIKYTIDRTDIDSIADPSEGDAFVTIDALAKGIELDDGSMLKFNKAGELVIETLDKIQKRVYDIGNTSLTTAEGKKIWTITNNYTETDGKLINNAPTKRISLSEANAAAEEEEAYQKSPEATAADWAEAHPNDTMLYVKPQATPVPGKHITGEDSIANDSIIKDGQVISYISREDSNKRNTEFESGTRKTESIESGVPKSGLSPEYIKANEDYERLKALGDGSGSSNGLFGAPSVDLLSGWKKIWDAINKPINKDVRSASFAPNIDLSNLETAKSNIEKIYYSITSAGDTLKGGVRSAWDGIKNVYSTASVSVSSTLQGWYSSTQSIYASAVSGLSGLSSGIQTGWSSIQAGISNAANAIYSTLQSWYSNAQSIYASAVSSLSTLYSGIQTYWSQIQSSITTLTSSIYSTLQGWYSNAQSVYNNAIASVSNLYAQLSTWWNSILSMVSSVTSSVYSTLQTWYSNVHSTYLQTISATQELLSSISQKWSEIVTTVQTKGQAVYDAVAGIPDKIRSLSSSFYNAGTAILESLKDSIADGFSSAIETAKDKLAELKSYLPNSPAKAGPFKQLPYWGDVIPGPILDAIKTTENVVTPQLDSMLGTVSSSLSSLYASASTANDLYTGAKSYSQASSSSSESDGATKNITNITTVKVNTINDNGNTLFTSKLKKAGL